jgi:protein-disulfide isomerase
MIAEPISPQLVPPVGARDHIQGPPDAAVTLVEYGDYQCPYCGEAYPIVKAIQKRMGSRLRFVFRNFPLGNAHPNAPLAAEAAEAAGAQGPFWEMHDMLYEHQNALAESDLIRYAERIGLDAKKFATALARHGYADRVREDFLSGIRSGVNGTPTFFVNGERHNGSYELEELLSALESAAGAKAASGAPKRRAGSDRRRSTKYVPA